MTKTRAPFRGKWPEEQVEILLEAFREYLATDMGMAISEAVPPMLLMQQIYQAVSYDLQYDNTHPAYHPGVWEVDGVEYPRAPRMRLVTYNPRFELYPEGCNDSHLYTLLLYIGKEVNII